PPPPSSPSPLSLHDALPIWFPSAVGLQLLHQRRHRRLEGVGDLLDDFQGRVALAPLQQRDVRAVQAGPVGELLLAEARLAAAPLDRKSTRLNSCHQIISYAV